MQNAKIIAQVGDTHSLKFEDMGKRRFIRLGASEKTPDVMQGTIHTSHNWAEITAADALGQLGLTLMDPETYDDGTLFAAYFITGAIAYTVHDDAMEADLIGVLASVREVPWDDHEGPDEAGEKEFERQYRPSGVGGKLVYEDKSVARELDAAIKAFTDERGDI